MPPLNTALRDTRAEFPSKRKGRWSLVRKNQQSSAHIFVKDFSSFFPESRRRSPLKKGADSKNPLNMENQRFKTPAIRDFIYAAF